ncbi:MAG: SMP-30/gluconolactonase/LRE family protein [Verrucomicrobiae bacterium]|nr:SMP-30/gluconolactonase/LRE family protein [Verrucomicrobiae bacterium]NNJ87617.1 SMP-30/gluconolactonase/LRE family protein [Akkermansiaceae bacterium]
MNSSQIFLFFSLAVTTLSIAEQARKPDLSSIIAPNQIVKQLATGMKFTEGPVWLPEQEIVVFSDIPNSVLMQWSAKEGLKPFRKVEKTNGNILDLQGRLLSCQHAGRNVIRTEKDGTLTVLVDKFEGKKFNSPNDLAIKSDGSIWFTDPSYGLRGQPGEIPGKWVFRFDPKTQVLTVVYKGFDMPNGIAFSPDEKRLYIADTGKDGVLRAFDVLGNKLADKPVFEIPIRCDGMCIDTMGNIYTTSKGGVHVYDQHGQKIGMIATPEHPANVCFGGKDFDTLFITARSSLYSVRTKMKGALPAVREN